MAEIIINKTKNIDNLKFKLPDKTGVYLLVGPNGAGKTTLLVCMDRICNPNAFARGFAASRNYGEVDQFINSNIIYKSNNPDFKLSFRKKTQRWAVSPKGKSHLLNNFGYSDSIFIRADSNRIEVSKEEIKPGNVIDADAELITVLNSIFETQRFNRLKRLKVTHGRGKNSSYFYIIQETTKRYYSEKRFSTGELALLRLVEKLLSVSSNSLVLLDEAEMALHPRIQSNLLDYLKKVAIEKQLTVLISTHSVTMIRNVSRNNIILLSEESKGNYVATTPCFPARAIGTVDFADNADFDCVFFVEDDMAQRILKNMIRLSTKGTDKCCASYIVIPIGGYEQTADFAINSNKSILKKSIVYAILDDDVFTESIYKNKKFRDTYEAHKDMIYSLSVTPEIWIVDNIRNSCLVDYFKTNYSCDLYTIVNSKDYLELKSDKPRKLAKLKLEYILSELCGRTLESEEVILDKIINILVSEIMNINDIKSKILPLLSKKL